MAQKEGPINSDPPAKLKPFEPFRITLWRGELFGNEIGAVIRNRAP